MGKVYKVPCVLRQGLAYKCATWVPVLGGLHEDVQFLEFPHQHYHYDIRFMSARQLSELRLKPVLQNIIVEDIIIDGPELKPRKCYRVMPTWPYGTAHFQDKLQAMEDFYCEQRVDLNNPICPHQGLPLVAEPDADGVVVCSGHGLSWSLRTGELVRRAKPGARAVTKTIWVSTQLVKVH